MAQNKNMAIKHAKAKKEAIKEVIENQNDFAQTSWAISGNIKKLMQRKPYACIYH